LLLLRLDSHVDICLFLPNNLFLHASIYIRRKRGSEREKKGEDTGVDRRWDGGDNVGRDIGK
jgi:hypothetical protein